ncbi:hypothetical protein AAVH_38567, partial [Aphelenchoides avenae]
MNVYLFQADAYERMYNCSFYDVNDVPLKKRQHVLLGYAFTIVFAIYEVLYIPCLIAIGRNLSQTCYVFMFYIGVVDILCLWINGFFTGK